LLKVCGFDFLGFHEQENVILVIPDRPSHFAEGQAPAVVAIIPEAANGPARELRHLRLRQVLFFHGITSLFLVAL
jgi:hypothetical protein